MRKHFPVLLWLLLVLACFHAAAGVVHQAHCAGPGSAAAVVAHAATDEAPADPAPGATHAVCTACVLQAHGGLPACPMPAAWAPMVSPAAPLPWATLEDTAHRAPWRSRFAARDPPTAG
ncbi:hypothetical protein ACFX58_01335 [Sphingomonas sp. NCPPB 2930]